MIIIFYLLVKKNVNVREDIEKEIWKSGLCRLCLSSYIEYILAVLLFVTVWSFEQRYDLSKKKKRNEAFYAIYADAFTRRRDRHAALRTRPRFNQLTRIRVIQSEPWGWIRTARIHMYSGGLKPLPLSAPK